MVGGSTGKDKYLFFSILKLPNEKALCMWSLKINKIIIIQSTKCLLHLMDNRGLGR
jgi:hypothetical protein